MTTGSQQITEEYEQLKELLELYPNISIVRTEGQPPNSYEIEYSIRGYVKKDDNTVDTGQTHRILLSLPFGYPHFAPTAKPLTPVFHPDFDPAAIRLADRWQQNPSLPELVLHIGEMICGVVYHLEEPFNQEAAEWYEDHEEQLPLDTISVADIEITDTAFDDDTGSESDRYFDHTEESIDSPSGDDLTSLRMEREAAHEVLNSADATDTQYIRTLVEDKKVFTANKLLSEFPQDLPFPDRDDIQRHIAKIFRKTDQLFNLAEQLETMSKFGEALEVLDEIQSLATDVPEVDAVRARINWAMQVAPPIAAADNKPSKRAATASQEAQQAPALSLRSTKLAGKLFTWANAIPFKPVMAVLLVLGIAIMGASLYFNDQNTLDQSQSHMNRGKMLIEKKQFDQAVETLEKAKAMLSDLTVLRFSKDQREQAINALLTSTELQEGLQGRILYQGEYISASTAATYDELAAMRSRAQSLVEQGKLDEALLLYRQVLRFTISRKLDKQQPAINEIIQSLEMRQSLAVAEKCERENNWDCAAAAYRKALSGNMVNLGTANDITSRMTAATFRRELDQSKEAFTQSQWQATIKSLEQAQQAIDNNPSVVSEKERQDLHRLLVNARLYSSLSTAREAFEQKNWDQAIHGYQNALNVLSSEPDATENNRDESLGKIEKTLLMVKITQIQEQITKGEKKEDLAANVARYSDIQRLINESAHQNDPAVKNIAQQIADRMEKQQELLLQREKIAWLQDHFEGIFRANYPTFKNYELAQPKAVFLKKNGKRLVFTLTCLARSQGSASKLELNYQFDTSNGKWSVSHD
jgi:Ubiquitin-protein ligase